MAGSRVMHWSKALVAKRLPQLASGFSRPGLALLQRGVNEGMDFAAHNVRTALQGLKCTERCPE